ncbi:hypothetical protein [Laspinema sp. D2d]|nr:hypothetical protein [Laspinema sp. D2d]
MREKSYPFLLYGDWGELGDGGDGGELGDGGDGGELGDGGDVTG